MLFYIQNYFLASRRKEITTFSRLEASRGQHYRYHKTYSIIVQWFVTYSFLFFAWLPNTTIKCIVLELHTFVVIFILLCSVFAYSLFTESYCFCVEGKFHCKVKIFLVVYIYTSIPYLLVQEVIGGNYLTERYVEE